MRAESPSTYNGSNVTQQFALAANHAGLTLSDDWADLCTKEGVYIKVEANGCVTERYKWVRHSFMKKVLASPHWNKRVPVRNGRRP